MSVTMVLMYNAQMSKTWNVCLTLTASAMAGEMVHTLCERMKSVKSFSLPSFRKHLLEKILIKNVSSAFNGSNKFP